MATCADFACNDWVEQLFGGRATNQANLSENNSNGRSNGRTRNGGGSRSEQSPNGEPKRRASDKSPHSSEGKEGREKKTDKSGSRTNLEKRARKSKSRSRVSFVNDLEKVPEGTAGETGEPAGDPSGPIEESDSLSVSGDSPKTTPPQERSPKQVEKDLGDQIAGGLSVNTNSPDQQWTPQSGRDLGIESAISQDFYTPNSRVSPRERGDQSRDFVDQNRTQTDDYSSSPRTDHRELERLAQ